MPGDISSRSPRCRRKGLRVEGRSDPAGASDQQPADQCRPNTLTRGERSPWQRKLDGRTDCHPGCGTTGNGHPGGTVATCFSISSSRETGRWPARRGGLGIGLNSGAPPQSRCTAGTVEATSAGPGKGSEFVVCLPALAEGRTGPLTGEARPNRRRTALSPDPSSSWTNNKDCADSLAMWLKTERTPASALPITEPRLLKRRRCCAPRSSYSTSACRE